MYTYIQDKPDGFHVYVCLFLCLCPYKCKSSQLLPQVLHYIPIMLMQHLCKSKHCSTVDIDTRFVKNLKKEKQTTAEL